MSRLELIRALYDYNQWANDHVLEVASALGQEEFARPQGASFDSVEGNLAHIVGGQIVWLSRWTSGTDPRLLAELESIRGLATIRQAFAESHSGLRQYAGSLSEEDLGRVLHYTDSRGTPHQRVMWQLMVHLANHGTHHRAETAMAMARMGRPMRELDYHFFEMERA